MALSLHQLSVVDAEPHDLIDIADRLGLTGVCLFTHVPAAAAGRYPLVSAHDVAALRTKLHDSGMTLSNLEIFPLDRSGAREDFESGLAIGSALGAARATAHLHDVSSEQDAVDRFARFAISAAAHGIVAGLEFNAFSAVRTLPAAERIVRAAGCGLVVLDMLHAVRSGAAPCDVERAADLIGYVQLCDGPAAMPEERRWHEAVRERLPAGEGEFPLLALARALRREVLFDIEVPQSAARKAGISGFDRAQRAVEASRRFLAEWEEARAC